MLTVFNSGSSIKRLNYTEVSGTIPLGAYNMKWDQTDKLMKLTAISIDEKYKDRKSFVELDEPDKYPLKGSNSKVNKG